MANIRLKELVEANVDPKLVARSKETGKLVYFKNAQNKDAAMKAGTHLDPKDKKGDKPKADAKPNDMFGGDYAKDRGGEAVPKVNLPKKASQLNSKHAESLEKAINAEVGLNGFVDTDDYTDAIIYTASTGNQPTYTLYFGSNSDYGKPDEFRVTFASTAIDNDPSNIGNKFDKPFKSAEDAMKYTIALAKKYKKELEMDDSKTSSNPNSKVAAPKADVKSIIKGLLKTADKEYGHAWDLKDSSVEIIDYIYDEDEDGKELKARLEAGEDGTYVQTDEMEGTIVFNDGSQYQAVGDMMGDVNITKVGKEEPKTSSKLSTMMPKSEPTPKIVGNWKYNDEDGRMSSDAADDVRNHLNNILGVDGMAEVDFGSGNIAYGLSDSENSIFVGRENGTYNVSYEGPSVDIDTINKSYKSFKNPKEALIYAGELAKANRKGLEQKYTDTGE
jgi:hypothetical protein